MRGERVGRQAFRSVVGSGSRLQVEDFMVETMEDKSEEVMAANEEKECPVVRRGSGLGPTVGRLANWLWIMLILLLKKDRKLLHLSTEKECEMVSIGLRSVLMVEKSILGLLLPD